MRVTLYTDHALRVLIYLGTYPDHLRSIAEIARAYDISQNNLMKVVSDLSSAGYIVTVRGRFGGIKLARPPRDISLGAVVRHTEGIVDLVDCDSCKVAKVCRLPRIFREALKAFTEVLDTYSLQDIIIRPTDFKALFPDTDGSLRSA